MQKQSFKLIFTTIGLIATVGLFSSCASKTIDTVNSDSTSQTSETVQVTPLTKALSEGAFLVDVRTPAEFAAGSVPGAINIPVDQVQNQLAQFKDKENIVVFCRSGGRSAQAMSILNQNGFNNVVNGLTWQNVNNNLKEVKK
jgi:phage shock protein E